MKKLEQKYKETIGKLRKQKVDRYFYNFKLVFFQYKIFFELHLIFVFNNGNDRNNSLLRCIYTLTEFLVCT